MRSCARRTWRSRTSSRTARRPAARTTSSRWRRSARLPAVPQPARPRRARRGAARDRHRTGREGQRRAVLLPHRRRRRARTRAGEPRHAAGDRRRVHPGDRTGAGEAGRHGGHRLPRGPRRRGVPPRRRRALPRRDQRGGARRLPLRRDPRRRCRGATPASPPASGARPAATARTPAGSSGCTGSTRSRCSPTCRWRTPGPNTSDCSRGSGSSSTGWSSRTGSSTSRPATSAASAARKYDIEAWFPSQGAYRELTSTSNCTTYQARRLNIRTRTDAGVVPVATLNGTLCAVARTIACLLDHHQQPDGSVYVPQALRPFLGGRDVLRP